GKTPLPSGVGAFQVPIQLCNQSGRGLVTLRPRWSWPAVAPAPVAEPSSTGSRSGIAVPDRTGRGRTDTCSLGSPASLPSPSGSPPASSPGGSDGSWGIDTASQQGRPGRSPSVVWRARLGI